MMNDCAKCLENNWKFDFKDGYVLAVCQNCGFDVEFLSKRARKVKLGKKIGKDLSVSYEIVDGKAYCNGKEIVLTVGKKGSLKLVDVMQQSLMLPVTSGGQLGYSY